jgi:hypothetical protein
MKIFCIGLSKTGTTSLTEALRILGFDAVHWYATKHAFRYTGDGIDIDWAFFERHDAFADTPIARIYPQLDERYPDAKFILTLREPDAWLASFADQFADGELDPFSARLHQDLYGTDRFDPDRCRAALAAHTDAVRVHFASRPDALLTMDVTGGAGWLPLCNFLDVAVPHEAFPYRFSRAERRQEARGGPSLRQRMLGKLGLHP